jgi:hypothetical protein
MEPANLEEALLLERFRLKKLGINGRAIKWLLRQDQNMPMGIEPPPLRLRSERYYDVATDVLYYWTNFGKSWCVLCINASKENYILRHRRRQWEARRQ